MNRAAITAVVCALALAPAGVALAGPYDAMISMHASANGVPESLVRRVIVRESRYRPHVISKGNYGMMQIRLATARGLGYTGTARGLLDPNTNLTYAVKYLAGAYRAAHGNHDLAVRYYAGGYYYAAKRQGWNANAQRVATSPGAPFAVASLNANAAAPAPAAAPAVLPPPPGSSAANRQFEAEVAAEARRNGSQPTGAVFNPFKSLSHPNRANAKERTAEVTNPLAAIFAPKKPERPHSRHRSRRHHRG